MPDGPVFDGACCSSQVTSFAVACWAALIACLSSGPLPAVFSSSASRSDALLLDVADACDPQVAGVADEIQLRLREQRRHALQFLRELRFRAGASGNE